MNFTDLICSFKGKSVHCICTHVNWNLRRTVIFPTGRWLLSRSKFGSNKQTHFREVNGIMPQPTILVISNYTMHSDNTCRGS
jgi:hypothetical protein